MRDYLILDLLPQPDDVTCGPTCLHGIYRYYEDDIELSQVIDEIEQFKMGGTLDVLLANHALLRGYNASIYTFNIQLFDPSWFFPRKLTKEELIDRLLKQRENKEDTRLALATQEYCKYLELGGKLYFQDLTRVLLKQYLTKNTPLLTGLSSTYLYRVPRVDHDINRSDDSKGTPEGHFVVLTGYNVDTNEIYVADPYEKNPFSPERKYTIYVDRVICSILLGILTYDANLLLIEPK